MSPNSGEAGAGLGTTPLAADDFGRGDGDPAEHEAVRHALRVYFAACRERIDPFVAAHLVWPGTLRLHRCALGLDLLRAPANVLLAVPSLIVHLAALGLHRARLTALARALVRVPLGFRTEVERSLARMLSEEILEQPATGGGRIDAMLGNSAFGEISPQGREALRAALRRADLDARMHELLARYAATRRASADLATALVLGFAGIIAYGQFTPGSLSAGSALASSVSRHAAAQTFLLGPTLGEWYYRWLPPPVPLGTLVATTALVALTAAVCSGFSGLVADPLQTRLGAHRRRLRRWLGSLEHLADGSSRGEYRPWDPYVARLADLADIFRALG